MVECDECGKTLGFFKSYQHPTMGKKHSLCSNCFDQVNESVSQWREFVLQNSFNNKTSKTNTESKYQNIVQIFNQRRNIVENVSAEARVLIRKK
jgi:hypothetical protein